MNLILTSDFPATPTPQVVSRIRAVAADPRIAWIAPSTDADRSIFIDARDRFGALGFSRLEYLDIDEERDDVQIAYLHEFDVIYLSAGDPVRFRYNALRTGLSGRMRQCVGAGRLIVAAGGGALLLTPNISLLRLETEPFDEVMATRARFDAMGAVPYELLPHAHRIDAGFMDKVLQYSACIDHDIAALAAGDALLHSGDDRLEQVGKIRWYRAGKIINQPRE